MSLLGDSTPVVKTQTGGACVVHCNNCGKDYYVQLAGGQTSDDAISNMVCTCGTSELVLSEHGSLATPTQAE
jgi:hypothetical protein